MDDHTSFDHHEESRYWAGHRFLLLITVSIGIAIILVSISMALYASSGTAQLDLSRPDYRAVSNQAVGNDKTFKNYPTVGELTVDAVDEFRDLYDTQATKAKAVDAFSGDPMNPDVLEISSSESAQ